LCIRPSLYRTKFFERRSSGIQRRGKSRGKGGRWGISTFRRKATLRDPLHREKASGRERNSVGSWGGDGRPIDKCWHRGALLSERDGTERERALALQPILSMALYLITSSSRGNDFMAGDICWKKARARETRGTAVEGLRDTFGLRAFATQRKELGALMRRGSRKKGVKPRLPPPRCMEVHCTDADRAAPAHRAAEGGRMHRVGRGRLGGREGDHVFFRRSKSAVTFTRARPVTACSKIRVLLGGRGKHQTQPSYLLAACGVPSETKKKSVMKEDWSV